MESSDNQSVKHKAVLGIFWRIGEQGGRQIIQFVVSVILARLIAPDQFGIIAMLGVFTALASVFADAGFSSALIRKTNRTQEDCSTIYWLNILISIGCYIILYLTSPLIADFYDMPELAIVLRVMAISIIINSFCGVQSTLLRAEMDFKSLTKFNLLGVAVSGIVGIVMAYMNFKVWALVGQMLSMTIITTICIINRVKWRPSFIISRKSFKELFGFGWKLLCSALLDMLFSNIYTLVIGKVFKAADLAFYNRAGSITNLTSSTPTGILQSVTYPTLCKLQDDEDALKNGYRRIIQISAFVIFPICLGVGAVAFPLINVLFTDVWMFSATLLSIMVFSAMWYPIHAINLNYLVVKGRSDLFLRLEIIKKIIGVVVLCVTVPFGLMVMCWAGIASSLISLFLNTYYTGKFLHMGIWSQLKDIRHILLLSLVMFAGARIVAMLMGNGILSLICAIATGVIIYAGGALLFRFPEVKELKNLKK